MVREIPKKGYVANERPEANVVIKDSERIESFVDIRDQLKKEEEMTNDF